MFSVKTPYLSDRQVCTLVENVETMPSWRYPAGRHLHSLSQALKDHWSHCSDLMPSAGNTRYGHMRCYPSIVF